MQAANRWSILLATAIASIASGATGAELPAGSVPPRGCPILAAKRMLGLGAKAPRTLYRPVFSTNVARLHEMRINKVFPAGNIGHEERATWLAPDAEFAEQTRMRQALYLNRPGDVFRVARGYKRQARAAGAELLEELASHLPTAYPEHYRLEGRSLRNLITGDAIKLDHWWVHPLVKAGLLVQDDITINAIDRDGELRLIAGFVATPTHWAMQDFLGMSVHDIHANVSNYDRIRSVVDGSARLAPGKITRRNNFFIESDPTLALPSYRRSTWTPSAPDPDLTDRLYLRSELETLIRLPKSNAVIFTIRPRVFRLDFLKEHAPEKARELAEAIQAPGSYYADAEWAQPLVEYLTAPAPEVHPAAVP
jgi:hypothetical protein